MQKGILAALMLTCVLSTKVEAEEFFHSTEIWGSISFGALLSGYQLDLPSQTLSPAPQYCSAVLPMLGIRTYFAGPLGIEASVGIAGTTTANFGQAYNSIGLYDYTMVNLGLIARYTFRLPRSGGALFFGAGANYSFLSLSSAYTSLFNGVSFYSVLSDIGGYARTGIAWYPSPGFFLDATAWYYYINAHFDVSGKTLDGSYLLFAFSLGLAF